MDRDFVIQVVDELALVLRECKAHYYKGNPVMTDDHFDRVEGVLKELDPDNPYFELVGSDHETM